MSRTLLSLAGFQVILIGRFCVIAEDGAAAFQTTERPRRQAVEKQKRIEFLEKKVQTKDEVLAELMAEHIALKKSLGEL
jgi:hypothetical protein